MNTRVFFFLDISKRDFSTPSITMSEAALSKGFGYGIVLGLGAAFALGMILITWLLKRYQNEVQTSEMFSTAGRTVKTGLVASAVVSSWTWYGYSPTYFLCASVVDTNLGCLLGLLHCCRVRVLRTDMVFLVPSGMLLAQLFRSSCLRL